MKNLFKILLLLWLVIPISCEREDIDDPSTDCQSANSYSKLISLKLDILGIGDKGKFVSEKQTDPSKIVLYFTTDEVEYTANTLRSSKFSFLPSALACQPSFFYSINTLKKLDIQSDGKIYTPNQTYLPSESLNELFYLHYSDITQQIDSISLDSFITYQNKIANQSYFLGFGNPNSTFIIRPVNAIDSLKNQTISFFFTLNDGRVINASTNEVEIN